VYQSHTGRPDWALVPAKPAQRLNTTNNNNSCVTTVITHSFSTAWVAYKSPTSPWKCQPLAKTCQGKIWNTNSLFPWRICWSFYKDTTRCAVQLSRCMFQGLRIIWVVNCASLVGKFRFLDCPLFCHGAKTEFVSLTWRHKVLVGDKMRRVLFLKQASLNWCK
jgi:hypothetical protein